jgi:hypothetical protein
MKWPALVPSRIANNLEKLPYHTAKPAFCHSVQWKNQRRVREIITHGAKHASRPAREPGHFPPDEGFLPPHKELHPLSSRHQSTARADWLCAVAGFGSIWPVLDQLLVALMFWEQGCQFDFADITGALALLIGWNADENIVWREAEAAQADRLLLPRR